MKSFLGKMTKDNKIGGHIKCIWINSYRTQVLEYVTRYLLDFLLHLEVLKALNLRQTWLL